METSNYSENPISWLCCASLLIMLLLNMQAVAVHAQRDISKVGPRTEPVALKSYAQVRYISLATGSNQEGDGSRKRPWASIAHALSKIDDANKLNQYAVLVTEGTYTTTGVALKPHVDLYGGFSTENWNRDIFENKTTLDANGRNRLFIGANDCRVDGFTLTGGRFRWHGGAILCDDATMRITNNVFSDNGTLEPEGYNRSRLHQPAHTGGAIALRFKGACQITNNIFVGNFTELGDGAAISCYESLRLEGQEILIADNVFVNNRAGVAVQAPPMTRASNGGAVACSRGAKPDIINNMFVGNQCYDNADAGAVYCEFGSSPLIKGNWFVGNRAYDDGGGIYAMKNSEPIIEDNIFAANWTVKGGAGGIRLSKEGRAIIRNNFFIHNQTGGGVANSGSWMVLENNTIVNNKNGGVSHNNGWTYYKPSIITGNIIRSNGLNVSGEGEPPIITHNNIEGGYRGDGNIDVDAMFVEDGIEGAVALVTYNTKTYTTEMKIAGLELKPHSLSGRVIHYGNYWSVVKTNDLHSIGLWGNATSTLDGVNNRAPHFRLVPSYRLQEDSPCVGLGAQ